MSTVRSHASILSYSQSVYHSFVLTANYGPDPIAESRPAERVDAIKNGIRRAAHKLKLITDDQADENDFVIPISDEDSTDNGNDIISRTSNSTTMGKLIDLPAPREYMRL